jgi:hypothetical protein
MSLPHNIERRLFAHGANHARYRGWDASGGLWFIHGTSGDWRARSRDGAAPTIFAPTLDRLGAKLAAIGKKEAA